MTGGPASGAGWVRQLAFGVRLAFRGGATGWTRVALTATAVGLGVAFLLLAASVPNLLSARDARESARVDYLQHLERRGDDTLLLGFVDTQFHGIRIRGRLLQPEGPAAPVPPGLTALPRPGEMVVSPALAALLSAPGSELLRTRLDYRIVGQIEDEGLSGPGEFAFYAGSDRLEGWSGVQRLNAFGDPTPGDGLSPRLMLLVIVAFVVLLTPVVIFIAAAVRFGGESRDRRLAALRLMGADRRMTRRYAAGEALAGGLLGLAVGVVLFLAGRQLIGRFTLWDISVFPADARPSLPLAVSIAGAVPALAVTVSLGVLRKIAVEPLGVVRRSAQGRRRLWWRLLLPFAGLALLAPLFGGRADTDGQLARVQVGGGAVLLLVGVVTLLPWLVEAVVRRIGGGGGVSWQLAVRRIQLDSASSARLVSGVAVAVAGAIALQTLVAGVESVSVQDTGADLHRAQVNVVLSEGATFAEAKKITSRFAATPGVRSVTGTATSIGLVAGTDQDVPFIMGACPDLREMAEITRCRPGDVFITEHDPESSDAPEPPRPGQQVTVEDATWTIPATVTRVKGRRSPDGGVWRGAVLATPEAAADLAAKPLRLSLYLGLDRSDPDAVELVRNTAAEISPLTQVYGIQEVQVDDKFAGIVRGILVGTVAILLLIGASMLATTLDQLRERRALLAALTAFGARRGMLTRATLWQMAVPVALGLVPAVLIGTGLGLALLAMLGLPLHVSPANLLVTVSAGAGVVALVTLASLPVQLRLMRPEGLRTE
ncbi:FtsX-like permease family protein [Sphaerimonospora thailandensis]|uniref:Membrane protein n=1 Tax=Sphaerimonospora thailandensis TaxID=795644 RepID=A0A8J3RB57_9ACTN|nr:FtsX-like permease family protein [Sphaerimonospora thailandensis]GIH71798.1 membrane protein [Sphaerimonospora thailandensis]